jgi:two-component system, OmpR family, sensor kinase
MPSRERARRASLRTRVAVAAAVVAALVGLVAAGVATFLVAELEAAAQDQRLTDAASLMQREIDAKGGDARRYVDDEAAEIAPIGLRMALFERGVRTAGAPDIPVAEREGCASRSGAAGRWRTCAVGGAARRVVVSTHREGDARRRGVLLLSVGGAALLAALVSALVSRVLAGWALAPLTALGARIEQISDATPADADLGEPSGTAEVEALRATIRGLLGRLGEAIERSRGFAASAAHELRTPLATMMAELELVSEESPAIAEKLARVRRTASRLSVLVERLLMIASGGAGALVTEAVAVEDVVRDVVAARPAAERARIEATFDATGMVRGDEALLRVVVDNLVDNALKFAEVGKVHVTVGDEGGEVRLTVRDEGPGIDPAEAGRLLLAFTRGTRGSEETVPGHGLGLSIVAHAVRLHGGDVRFVARAPSEAGAELRVTLPAWTASATALR